MFGDIPRNVWRHSPKCLATFPGMFEDIPRNVWRHSPEYNIPLIPRVPRIPFPIPVFLFLYIATFKAWLFSSDFNFACKDSQVTAATCKNYFPPYHYQVAKSCILSVVGLLDLSLKTSPCTKTTLFSYYFEMLPPLSKLIVFFSVTFYSMMKYF